MTTDEAVEQVTAAASATMYPPITDSARKRLRLTIALVLADARITAWGNDRVEGPDGLESLQAERDELARQLREVE